MTIITCTRCGKKYSDNTPQCPGCGNAMKPTTVPLIHDAVRFFGWLALANTIIGAFMFIDYLGKSQFIAEIYLGSGLTSAMVGCLLLSKRPAWMCISCKHYRPRSN